VEARLQRRVQRYGWDLAAKSYEPLWKTQLAVAQSELLARAALVPGEQVLDVACGTGLVAFGAAEAVGPSGSVVGIDLSDGMVNAARRQAETRQLSNVRFERMDAEFLVLPDHAFDACLCALGLMYMPNPERAVLEMRRVTRPAGRIGLAVWGERSRCGWSVLFPIVDAEISGDVCPLFFRLGKPDALARLCVEANCDVMAQHRFSAKLIYANADDACDAAFVGGPVALAWSHFDEQARVRVRARYLEAIDPWREGPGYRIPVEFVVIEASAR
jgi:ubiquinone/menaquinone biosynthesis C-methylase UbiE